MVLRTDITDSYILLAPDAALMLKLLLIDAASAVDRCCFYCRYSSYIQLCLALGARSYLQLVI